MRQLVYLVCCLGLGMPDVAHAQVWTQTQTPASSPSGSDSSTPQTPPAPAQEPAATAPAEAEPEVLPSLFEPTWHQFMFGGRWSDVSGDPARWQRYQDLRDGVLFRDARFAREDPDGLWLFRAMADNVGYRDQRFFATYERTGRFVISGLWDEIPQFYSVDTKTPFTRSGSPLLLDDATQRAVQNGQATPPLSAYLPIASQFDLRERRDIGNVNLVATPTQHLDLTAAFTSQRHTGELPWGASFGFSNDVEVGLPYDSRTNDFTLGAEWTNNRNMLRVAYNGSWFDNLDDTLVWDSPLRLDDSAEDGPGRGRMSLWPSNSAQTVSAAGYTKFARRTQLTGFLSFGFWNNNEPLQPFTINAALPQFALPRSTADAETHVFSTNLNLVSRPLDEWRFSARVRRYDYSNETPHADITDYIAYDDGASTSPIGGPRLYAYNRTTFDADATWTGLPPLAFTVGYTRNDNGYDFRVFDDTSENVLHLTADAIGSQWVTFRAEYELADRSGSGLNEDLLVQTGEQPAMRHYDVANRSRNKFTGQVDVTPNDVWMFSASAGLGEDNYDDSYFGLQESTFRVFSLSADYQAANGLGAGASYNYERYSGLQRSRSASSGQSPPQETDPRRDWTTDSAERVNYFSIYAKPPRIGDNTEARLSYDYSYAEGKYLYGVVTGGPLPPPSQLPKVYNKLQQLHVDVRHRISKRLAATLSYLYEPFRVYDFAFDPSVVNSIVQPSSLVLGYVYRPYTAHSAAFGIMYFW
jgi:MtrB/PioB family decaheme-associated outer membrane protein